MPKQRQAKYGELLDADGKPTGKRLDAGDRCTRCGGSGEYPHDAPSCAQCAGTGRMP